MNTMDPESFSNQEREVLFPRRGVEVDTGSSASEVLAYETPLSREEIARRRGVQTAVQGLAIDVAVAVAVLVLSSLDSITSKAALVAFGMSLAKTVVSSVAAWVVRRYSDRSGFVVPENPAVPGEVSPN